MNQISNVVQFPFDAQSNSFFCALASMLLPALDYTEQTPYFCAPKGSYCVNCGCCGWRWPNTFIRYIMGIAGLTWRRFHRDMTMADPYDTITKSIDLGFPVMARFADGPAWQIISGYNNGVLYGIDSYRRDIAGLGAVYNEDGLFALTQWRERLEVAIIVTGRCASAVTFKDIIENITHVLEHPAHAMLEEDVMKRIEKITPQNAMETVKWLNSVASFPIEARWHAAESFCSSESAISRRAENTAVRDQLGEAFFRSYIMDNSGETHGTCWKIWAIFGVCPQSNYTVSPTAAELLQRTETQQELKRLFAIIFDNDRKILNVLREASKKL